MSPHQAFVRARRRGRRGAEEATQPQSPESTQEAGTAPGLSWAAMRASASATAVPPSVLRPADVLGLQETVGNRATVQHLQRMSGHQPAIVAPARIATSAGGPLRRRELSPSEQRRLATSKLAADPVAHILTYYPDHALTTKFGEFQKLHKQRDASRAAFQGTLSAAGGVGGKATQLSAQDQTNLKQAAKSPAVLQARDQVNTNRAAAEKQITDLRGLRSQLKERIQLKKGVYGVLEGVKLDEQANASQTELNALNEQKEQVKHKVEALAEIGEKIATEIFHPLEMAKSVIGVGLTQSFEKLLGQLGPLGANLDKRASELEAAVFGNQLAASAFKKRGLDIQIKAYTARIADIHKELTTNIELAAKTARNYVDSLETLNKTLKTQPGLKGLTAFDQQGKDSALLEAFFGANIGYQKVIEDSDTALKATIEALVDAKRQFTDPNFGAALNSQQVLQGQWQPDEQNRKAGEDQGNTLKKKLDSAMDASMGALR